MNNIKTLVKNDILGILNKFSKNKTKLVLVLFSILLCAVFYSYYFLSYSIDLFRMLDGSGSEHLILISPLLMFCNFIVLFIITNSVLTTEKDSDFLLSLPLKKSSIIISKAILTLCVLFTLGLIIFIPTIIYYQIAIEGSLLIILNGFIVLFLTSFFFCGVGYLFNSFLNFFVIRLRLYKLFRIIIVLLTVFSFLYFYINIPTNSQTLRVFGISHLIDFIIQNDLIVLLMLTLLSSLTFFFGVALFSKCYGKKPKTFKNLKLKLNLNNFSSLRSLIHKEFICYFNSTVYLFNTIVGHIILIGGSIYLFFTNSISITIIYLCVCSSLSLCCTTNSSISLEGKNIWILKSSPTKTQTILLSKVLVNLIMLLTSIIISFVIILFTNKYDISTLILLFILSILISVFISFGGILINLLLPKLEFKNEISVVKQSAAAIISILFFLVFLSLPSILFMFQIINMPINTIIVINCIYIFIFDLLLILISFKFGKKLFDKL